MHQLYPHGGRSRPGPQVSTAAAATTSCVVSDRPRGSFCFVSCQPALRTKWRPPLASSGPPPPRSARPPSTGPPASGHGGRLTPAGPRHARSPLRRGSPPHLSSPPPSAGPYPRAACSLKTDGPARQAAEARAHRELTSREKNRTPPLPTPRHIPPFGPACGFQRTPVYQNSVSLLSAWPPRKQILDPGQCVKLRKRERRRGSERGKLRL